MLESTVARSVTSKKVTIRVNIFPWLLIRQPDGHFADFLEKVRRLTSANLSRSRMNRILIRCARRKYCTLRLTVLAAFALVLIYNYEYTRSGVNRPTYSPGVDRRSRESQMTGRAFSGKATRRFTDKRKFEYFKHLNHPTSLKASEKSPVCNRWGVVTTIFEPSEAVRRQVRLEGWCLVVIADKISVKEYNTGWFPGQGNDAVVYLTPEEQEAMKIPFVDGLPWNHFGRKNVGFLYAILHGAEIIWDFDDDNLLKFWLRGAGPPGAPSLDASVPGEHNCVNGHMEALLPKEHNWPTYNPYPKLGAPSLPSWPRGLPLEDIKKPQSFNTTLTSFSVGCSDIAILQSLAEYQPDVDAIFRFT